MNSGSSGLHEHCETCIKVTRCSVLPEPGRSCSIISCALDCKALFHACKKNEHDELCPNKQTSCLNAEYGCPERMQRRHLAKHLSTCAASVVHCPMEWIRGDVSKHTELLQIQENNEQLDSSFLLRDQRQRKKYLENIAQGYSPIHILPQKSSYPYALPEDVNISEAYDSRYYLFEASENVWHRNIQDDLKILTEQPTKILLDMNPSCCKEAKYFLPTRSFSCAQVFRRDEFRWHCQNVHGDVLGSIGGWLEERCPLAEYGCQFSVRRLYPVPKNSTVIYSREMECLALRLPSHPADEIRTVKHNSCGNHAQDKEEHFQNAQILFTDLPYEILRHIGTYLDGFSLDNLSQTCHLMRNVCNSLLKEKGLVLISWKKKLKDGRVYWQNSNFHWSFSASFTPIRNWYFGNEHHMSNHLKDCPYFDRNKHDVGAPQIGDLIKNRGEGIPVCNGNKCNQM